jgi:3-deoxy-7-phosphoheptulonate synthase
MRDAPAGHARMIAGILEQTMRPTQDLRVSRFTRLSPPRAVKAALPVPEAANATVVAGRERVAAILRGEDPRLLVVVGPCSINDPRSAHEYAVRLAALRAKVADALEVVMRVYFEKPRTTVGWKGLINDPHLDGSQDIETGISLARSLLIEINALGLPAATEFLDPIVPQYLDDLVAWAAIGARTTESQTHREMASGLSMPVGFKNATDGGLQVAVDAMRAAREPHSFLGIDPEGFTSVVRTVGNPVSHVVLRGGAARTNYDAASIRDAESMLAAAGLPPAIMVDCSHANSAREAGRQPDVWRSVLAQRLGGTRSIIGLMLESHLNAGRQPFPRPAEELSYGVSITDPCLGWQDTERLLLQGCEALSAL